MHGYTATCPILCPGTNYYRNRVIKVAKEFVGKLSFAISSWEEFGHEVNEYGFEKGANPVVGIRDAKGMKYKMAAEYRWGVGQRRGRGVESTVSG